MATLIYGVSALKDIYLFDPKPNDFYRHIILPVASLHGGRHLGYGGRTSMNCYLVPCYVVPWYV